MTAATNQNRRSIRLKGYDYSQTGSYFITICARDRESLFGDIKDEQVILNKNGLVVQRWWGESKIRFKEIELDEFVVMPNHFHGIIHIASTPTVGAIHELPLHELPLHENPIKNGRIHPSQTFPVGAIHELVAENDPRQRRKMLIPQIIGWFKMNSSKNINQIRNSPGIPVWQRNYYDHIIRHDDELNQIREYIINNPIKWDYDHENPYCRGNPRRGDSRIALMGIAPTEDNFG